MNKKTFSLKKSKAQKKAFSLIELSIVLIIIGLLVAGVTGGASLVKNATLRSVMSEARGYQTAVNGFFERFQALPGDYSTLIGGTFAANIGNTTNATGVVGNANGQIEYFASATAATAANRLEGNIAWQQLKNAAFIDASFTPGMADTVGGATTISTGANPYVLTPSSTALPTATAGSGGIPASKIANGGWAFDFVTFYAAGPSTTPSAQNVVILTGAVAAPAIAATIVSQSMQPTAVVIPVDALSIDTKTDDGLPRSGKVRSAGGVLLTAAPGTATSPVIDGLGLAGCNGAAAYTTATATVQCALAFQVDPNS